MRRIATAMALSALMVGSVNAATMHRVSNGCTLFLVLQGRIIPGDLPKFRRMSVDVDRVMLDSIGGNLYEAIQIALEVKSRNIDTVVTGKDICVSSCALISMAGRVKYSSPQSKIGVHQASLINTNIAHPLGNQAQERFFKVMGYPEWVAEEMHKTPPSKIRLFSVKEKISLGYKWPMGKGCKPQ